MSKKTIGLNPLEEYLSSPRQPKKVLDDEVGLQEVIKVKELGPVEPTQSFEVDGLGQLAIKGTQVPEGKRERPTKQRITLHISSDIVDRVKNAVYWEPGLTVAGFAEEAFMKEIEKLEQERGAPFPQRKQHRLRGGRPVS